MTSSLRCRGCGEFVEIPKRRIMTATAREDDGDVTLHVVIDGRTEQFAVAPHVARGVAFRLLEAITKKAVDKAG